MDVNFKVVAMPVQAAGSNGEAGCVTLNMTAAALGHGPARVAAIQGDIERAIVFRISRATFQRSAIVRREHAANKGDDGQAVVAVVTERIDVPPEITTRRDRLVESR